MPEYIKLSDAQECIKDYLKQLITEGKENVEITEFNAEIQKRLDEVPAMDGVKEFIKRFEKKIKDVKFTIGQTREIQSALKAVEKEMAGASDG